jgi:hypothetical protein
MRTLLSCLALALLAGIIGCGEPAAPEKPADKAPAENTDGDKSASASTSSEMQEVSLNVPAMS